MKKLLVIILLSLTICGCSNTNELTQYKETTINAGFDTIFTLVAYTSSQEEFDGYFTSMRDNLYHYHELFDKYDDYDGINNIKTINDNAGVSPVVVDQVIIDMLLMAKEYYTLTDGYFDVTIGAVLEKWHYCRDQAETNGYGCVPTTEELQSADEHTGWDLIQIDTINNTVYITDPLASLDVGGIAKGYAVELVAQKLESDGLTYGAINGGGNVRTINSKPDGSAFTVGITNPDNRGGDSIDILSFDTSYAFVTSGDYERYYIDEYGNRYHHIIDPFTLYPSKSARSVTIIYPNSAIADILSTACFVMDYQTALNFINSLNDDKLGVVWLYDIDNHPNGIEGIEVSSYFEISIGNITSNN